MPSTWNVHWTNYSNLNRKLVCYIKLLKELKLLMPIFGLSNTIDINKLHYIQNSAARVLTFSRKCTHITLIQQRLY